MWLNYAITASMNQLKETNETKSQGLWACPSRVSWCSLNLEILCSRHLSCLIPMFGNFLSLLSYRTLSCFPTVAAKHDSLLFSPVSWYVTHCSRFLNWTLGLPGIRMNKNRVWWWQWLAQDGVLGANVAAEAGILMKTSSLTKVVNQKGYCTCGENA